MHTISYTKLAALATILQERRELLGFSARETARRSHMHVNTYLRLERCEQGRPSTQSLTALAEALQLPLADLFDTLGWLPNKELPSLQPYLRSRYKELPDDAVQEMAAYFKRLSDKYNMSDGPGLGEDEQ